MIGDEVVFGVQGCGVNEDSQAARAVCDQRLGTRSARWEGEEFAHRTILDTSDVAMFFCFFFVLR